MSNWDEVEKPEPLPSVRRQQLAEDLAAFLAKGGKITVVAPGESTSSEYARKVLGLAPTLDGQPQPEKKRKRGENYRLKFVEQRGRRRKGKETEV